MDYKSAENFLKMLKDTGARQSRPGYRPLGPAVLRRACEVYNRTYHGVVTWHIVYGVLDN